MPNYDFGAPFSEAFSEHRFNGAFWTPSGSLLVIFDPSLGWLRLQSDPRWLPFATLWFPFRIHWLPFCRFSLHSATFGVNFGDLR